MKYKIEVKELSKKYDELKVLDNLSFNVNEGEFVCLIGPNGCGKSTILNTIAGFIQAEKGSVLLDNKSVKERSKKIGYVFQTPTLFPWINVENNIGYSLKIAGMSKEERKKKVKEYLELFGLVGFEKYYPGQLSGGMAQKAAIARALIFDPEVILMDEPFASLDVFTRGQMQEFLSELYSKSKKTTIYVTHYVDEGLMMADRIILFSKRPSCIKKEIIIDTPKPRSVDQIMSNPYYIALKKEILHFIKEESK